jgi:two-component system chemotaxis response regulator CheY
MNIGQKIRSFRERLTITQAQLGHMVYVSENAIGNYESGRRNPNIEILKQIADALKVEINDFFEEEKKSLLQLPMNYVEFRKWGEKKQSDDHYGWFTGVRFEYMIKSDRYFVLMKNQYLIWLKDGFYLVPTEKEWVDGDWNDDVVKIEKTRKVIKNDLAEIQAAIGRKFHTYNEKLFAEGVYSSKYDFLEPNDFSHQFFDDMKWAAITSDNIMAYVEKKSAFYVNSINGIIKLPVAKEILEEIKHPYDIFEKEDVFLEEPESISDKELSELNVFILEEEYFIKRMFELIKKEKSVNAEYKSYSFDEVENMLDTIEQTKELHEIDYDTISNFLRYRLWSFDNLKRILRSVNKKQDSLFSDTWEEEEIVKTALVCETEKEKEQERQQNPKEYTFLLVEDGEFMREVAYSILSKHFNCYIDEAENDTIAFEKYKKQMKRGKQYDLVIIDSIMPGQSGLEAVEKIKEMDKDARIIISGSTGNETENYIAKPYDEKNMVDTIKKVLPRNRPYKFLVADDAPFMRAILSNILYKKDCEIYEAEWGQEAIDLYKRHMDAGNTFDLVLLDVTMPQVDGVMALEKIMMLDKKAKVLMLASYTDQLKAKQAMKKGAIATIEKPFRDEDVKKMVESVLKKK